VLGLDHFGSNRITELRNELLKIKMPAEVRKLDENPADYLFPYIRNSMRTAATLCAKHAHFGKKSTHGNGVTSFDWEWNQSNRRDLISSMNSLQRFVTFPEIDSGIRPLRLQQLLPDYAVLIEETQVIGSDLQGILQQQANSAVMDETKRGIAQADSVRR
jgi:ribosomal protein L29